MLHKSLAAALVLAASAVAPAAAAPAPEPYRLLITVSGSGSADGTHELTCRPAGGDHADPAGACDAIAAAEQPFVAADAKALCTYMYGGPATATIEGTWAGEPVRATFSRENGCEIARWDALVPALPAVGA
ncbi:SSI family serine proteinase inhibitor [Streptomyces litchfieldiae]|uniref:SSI family serine proteinase inhibitor n=1 Tax=Streptomyces litchfieldiae TaxID=3075543 RepID=A0ABU2MKL0_9ACTN|nr:SSI family serine proteinase inhibitor [Streptomyces sp. DSM 44938]MDT0342030.1 SSI family serine proteinase inhibitor [Streptomyces sp. DSM 44938]